MKVNELIEMTVKAGKFNFPVDLQSISKSFDTEIEKAEGDKYSIKRGDGGLYGLFEQENLLSFLRVKQTSLGTKKFNEVLIIFTPVEFRAKGLAMILLYAVKTILEDPLLFDNALFDDGWELIQKMNGRDLFDVKIIDKTSHEITALDKFPKKNQAIVIEAHGEYDIGLWVDYGAGIGKSYFTLFDD